MKLQLKKTSFIDFPARISSVFFFPGCNLRCPWCHNRELVTGGVQGLVSLEDALAHLRKRRGVLGGVVLSGGEPCLYEELPDLIAEIKAIPLPVKLDTNGMLPAMLEKLFSREETSPDYIALDLKIASNRYAELVNSSQEEKNKPRRNTEKNFTTNHTNRITNHTNNRRKTRSFTEEDTEEHGGKRTKYSSTSDAEAQEEKKTLSYTEETTEEHGEKRTKNSSHRGTEARENTEEDTEFHGGRQSEEEIRREKPGSNLIKSAALIRESGIDHEYRTLALPGGFISASDIEALAPLADNAPWYFRPFAGGNCLDPAWNDMEECDETARARLEALAARARELGKRACVPGE